MPSCAADGGEPLAAHPSRQHGSADPLPVLLCGYYGEHNLGDDALLEALLQLVPAGVTPLVTAFDEAQVRERFGVATVQRRSLKAVLAALGGCRALVLGGGSLLQDATSFRSLLYYGLLISAARLQGKPVLLWAQGLGPLRRRRSRALVRPLLAATTGISWRDPQSADLAASLGVRASYGSDAVWALPAQPWIGSGGPIIVCWRPTAQLQAEAWRPYLHALELLAEAANREVLWLPFHRDQDTGLLERLSSEGLLGSALRSRSRELQVQRPQEAMALFRTAGLVVAMRLHALILAALSGAPVAALSYDPKVQACALGIGCHCHALGDDPPDHSVLLASWREALDQPIPAAAIAALQADTGVHRELLRQLEA